MDQTRVAGPFPVAWLLGPAFGTWIAVALTLLAIRILPTTKWLLAFNVFWIISLTLCVVVLGAIGLALKRLFDSDQYRSAGNIVVVVAAPVVTAIGIFMMLAILAPLSGCC